MNAYDEIIQETKYIIFKRMKEEKIDMINIHSLLEKFGVIESDYKMYLEICYANYSPAIDKSFTENFKIAWNMLVPSMDIDTMLVIEKLIIIDNQTIDTKTYEKAIDDAKIFNKLIKE